MAEQVVAHLKVAAHAVRFQDGEVDGREFAVDVLTDLRHFCVVHAVDFQAAVEASLVNFTAEEDEAFDQALALFLETRVPGTARKRCGWVVKAEADDEWEIELFIDGEFAGRWRITVSGSELLDATAPEATA